MNPWPMAVSERQDLVGQFTRSVAAGRDALKRIAIGAPLVLSAAALSGCMASPTYGTGKSSSVQLLEDVTGMVSLGDKKRDAINYTPRPELVKPAKGAGLVAPQEEITASANPNWPESPEQRRERIKAEATANQDNPNYRAPVIIDTVAPRTKGGKLTLPKESIRGPGYDNDELPSNQREEFNRRLASIKQGDPNKRKFLSEPPVAYRAPEATAPTGDVGEDEWRKERRVKRSKGGGLRGLFGL